MRFDVLTLFPEMFSGYLTQSLLKLAIERRIVDVQLHDIRRWAHDRHHQVDDRPFGGGPGMVLKVDVVVEAVEAVRAAADPSGRLVLLTPQGRRLTQPVVEELAAEPRLLLLCGRYEGFDQRVHDILEPDEISIGDYILGGGEVPAMVVIDAVVRLIPGVLGAEESSHDDSFSTGNRLLEFPQYTRPREYRGLTVPEVLLGGDHGAVARWRQQQSLERTRARRADLLEPEPTQPTKNQPREQPSAEPRGSSDEKGTAR
ncbi:MAG: tRNA (guanosine(37)-N1)-methyltransferase TrmD [Pirellulales bacterium]